jgi:glycosyltransferase 2 family protein
MSKRLMRWLGILFALAAGLYFIRYAEKALIGKDLSGLMDGRVMLAAVLLTTLYILLIPTTALAWTWLLRAMHQPARYRQMLPIMAITQFGKYLPGNVAQHIGRIALARTAGLSLPAALFSVAYEMLLMLVACAHISALTLLWAPPTTLSHWKITGYRLPLLLVVTFGAIVGLLLAPRMASWLARYRASRRGDQDYVPPQLHLNAPTALACYAVYAVNFCLIGGGLWFLAHALLADSGTTTPSAVFLTGAFAGSWILGFIAPGAPAGLGIREAILSTWLSGSLPPAQIVLLVIALRIATTLGDLFNFIWGSLAAGRGRGALSA